MSVYISFSPSDNKIHENIIFTSKNNITHIDTFFIRPNITNYEIVTFITKIKNIINSCENINICNINFDKKITNEILVNNVLSKLSDILYCYFPNIPIIKLSGVSSKSQDLLDELLKYKNIVMDPNKNPETYLKYVLSRVPKKYKANVFKISKNKKYNPTKMFPLTKGVGGGSIYDAYFVHIQPKSINKKLKNIYLLGKAVTFDSGGMNLKGPNSHIEEMKTDMTGSALIISVLNLLDKHKLDKFNIHLLMPIVENMISNDATRPGMTIKSMSNKVVEIVDTDAEGRLCLADAIDYVNLVLMKKYKSTDNLIIDIATLTGNTRYITNGISCIIMGNNKSLTMCNTLMNVGEHVGEYVDYLKLRPEYLEYLRTTVGNIANVNKDIAKCGCLLGGSFLEYFTNPDVPWIHMDVASNTFIKHIPTSYGINLLYYFITRLYQV